jgi:hypothetical protein
MTPDEMLEALNLALRLKEATRRGLTRAEEDHENSILLKAMELFSAEFNWELDRDDDRRTSDKCSGAGDVSRSDMGK